MTSRAWLATFWVACAWAVALLACRTPAPNPVMLGSYEAAAEACAQVAVRVDAGQAARWRVYDYCEHEAWRRFAPDGGAP